MKEDWAEKYRPRSLRDIAGNPKALSDLTGWAEAWQSGRPNKKGAILAGRPGTGKTSAALALASDFGWGVIELNASDVRSADAIRATALAGSVSETFSAEGEFLSTREGKRKLIIFDEADNLYERARGGASRTGDLNREYSDKGGKKAIREVLKLTIQPVILIVNDLYALTRGGGFKPHCVTIKFQKVGKPTMRRALSRVCADEGVRVSTGVLDAVVERSEGDMRSALNDLQSLAEGEHSVEVMDDTIFGRRDTKITAMEAVRKILKAGEIGDARKAAWELKETPSNLLTWLDENLPREFRDPGELAAAYERVSRADVFLGRVMRRQNYRLWAYASDLMTCGMVVSRRGRPSRGFTPYQFPRYMIRMGQSRGRRAVRDSLALKIGRACHCSMNQVKVNLLENFRTIIGNEMQAGKLDFICRLAVALRLEETEIGALAGNALPPDRMALAVDTVERLRETPEEKRVGIALDFDSLLREKEEAKIREAERKKAKRRMKKSVKGKKKSTGKGKKGKEKSEEKEKGKGREKKNSDGEGKKEKKGEGKEKGEEKEKKNSDGKGKKEKEKGEEKTEKAGEKEGIDVKGKEEKQEEEISAAAQDENQQSLSKWF